MLFLLCNTAHAAFSYNAVAEFSTTDNTDTSRWSYRYTTDKVRDGDYELLTSFSDPGSLWNPATSYWNNGGGAPAIGVNNTGGNIAKAGSPTFNWPDQTIWMNPGSGGFVVVSWLAPVDAVVDIDFMFYDMDHTAGSIDWILAVNDGSGFSTQGFLFSSGTGDVTRSNVSVQKGDRINFIVDPNSDADYDSTAFSAVIRSDTAVVPSPSCLPLLCSGLLVLAGRRRKADA